MSLRSEDFESSASAVSPPRHIWEVEAHPLFYFPRSREAMRRRREEFCQTRRASDKPPRYKSRHARQAQAALRCRRPSASEHTINRVTFPPLLCVFAAIDCVWVIAMRLSG